MKVKAYTYPGDFGQVIYALEAEWKLSKDVKPNDFDIECNYAEQFTKKLSDGIKNIKIDGGVIRFEFYDFLYIKSNFIIKGKGPAEGFLLTKAEVTEVSTKIADDFEKCEENGIRYRLYTPATKECRPLVLFLHGGGEKGYDNNLQLVGYTGPTKIAESYPDVYVMAPQTPGRLYGNNAPPISMYKLKYNTLGSIAINNPYGWNRENLAAICAIIRRMIAEGKVDEKRVYVTGLSMGGGGTIMALSVGAGLFAAAIPICPTMTPETYAILCGLTKQKLWVATACVDHTIFRHKYIVDAIFKLRDAGNNNARLTLFSPEELEAYGLGVDENITLEEKCSQYHNSAILVYHNEHGILDWMMEQVKD